MRKLEVGDVIHCKNFEEFEILKEICEESDVQINFGVLEIQTYGDETCYRVDGYDGISYTENKELFYADIEFYSNMGYKIITIDEVVRG